MGMDEASLAIWNKSSGTYGDESFEVEVLFSLSLLIDWYDDMLHI